MAHNHQTSGSNPLPAMPVDLGSNLPCSEVVVGSIPTVGSPGSGNGIPAACYAAVRKASVGSNPTPGAPRARADLERHLAF